MIQNLILTTIAETDFREIVSAAVRSEMAVMYPQQKATAQPELLTRHETAQRLKISLPTLHLWTRQGTVQGYRISGRVLYKSNEVENSLQAMQTIKNR
jgi:hypothetical protein